MVAPSERVLRIRDFDLALTLGSGQFFRAERRGGFYLVAHRDRPFLVRQEGSTLLFRGIDVASLVRFLALDFDAHAARARLARHAWLRPALDQAAGLRILRQDPWECLVGFLCSTISNIPRIRGCVERLAERFGRPVGEGDLAARSFPRPGEIRKGRPFDAVRLGFRGRHLLALQQHVDEAWLAALERLPEDDQRRWLSSLPGVGEKVADCVLLFALGRGAAFPMDVWIRRVVERRVFRRRTTYEEVRAWARRELGEDAGYAQQAMFEWARREGREGI